MTVLLQTQARYDIPLGEFVALGLPKWDFNIAYPCVKRKVEAAIRRAGASDLVSRLSKGLETSLGPSPLNATPASFQQTCVYHDALESFLDDEEEGDSGGGERVLERKEEIKAQYEESRRPPSFSGGEWQKICLARSFLRSPELCCYDEMSSALDPLAEAQVFRDIYANKREDQTVLYITHRMNMAAKADKIIMLDKGRCIEVGSHEELMAKGGKYHEFYTVQQEGFLPIRRGTPNGLSRSHDKEEGKIAKKEQREISSNLTRSSAITVAG
ncbi:P-loop containing nucleoside triphosphate hydrolase protein [Atractiella rhizophila]|nr:P-loop containing nucleoside triphosphate hydrolase protein [Atractiella rhizophila]